MMGVEKQGPMCLCRRVGRKEVKTTLCACILTVEVVRIFDCFDILPENVGAVNVDDS
jgi:hypothetical protein